MTTDSSVLSIRLRQGAVARIRTEAGVTGAVASIAAVLAAAVSIRGPVDFTRISNLWLAWAAGAFVILAILALLTATVLAIRADEHAKPGLIDAKDTNDCATAVTKAGRLLQLAHYAGAAAILFFVIAALMTWIWSDEVVIQTQDGGTGGDVHTFCGRLMTSSNTGVAFVRTKDGQVHAIKISEIKSNSDATCP
jgi:hypothetical protein